MNNRIFWSVFWAIMAVQVTNILIGLVVFTGLAAIGRQAQQQPSFESVATELAP